MSTNGNTAAVRSLYDAIAPCYDARYLDPFSLMYDDVTWRLLDGVLAQVPRGAPVLDLAAGTGYVTVELAKRGYESVTAVDLSPSMLAVLEGKLAAEAPERAGSVITLTADFHDLSALPAGRYAAAFCQGSALCCSHDPRAVVAQARRLVRPGGLVNFSVHNRFGSVEKILSKGRGEEVGAAVGAGRWYWYERGEPVHELHLFTEAELVDLGREFGLEVVAIVGKLVLSRSFVEKLHLEFGRAPRRPRLVPRHGRRRAPARLGRVPGRGLPGAVTGAAPAVQPAGALAGEGQGSYFLGSNSSEAELMQ